MAGNNLEHVSAEVQDLAERGWAVTLEEYQQLRLNGYEREFLIAYVDFETLKHIANNVLDNCAPAQYCTYDCALQTVIVPELLDRLERLLG